MLLKFLQVDESKTQVPPVRRMVTRQSPRKLSQPTPAIQTTVIARRNLKNIKVDTQVEPNDILGDKNGKPFKFDKTAC